MLVRSANDAAEALALHVGKGSTSRFVALMNAKARELGLADTNFENPHGLDGPGTSRVRATSRPALGALGVRSFATRSRGRRSRSPAAGLPDDGRPARELPLVGGKDRAHARRRLVAGRGRQAQRRTDHGSVLGSPSEAQRETTRRASRVRPRAVPPRQGNRRPVSTRAPRPATAARRRARRSARRSSAASGWDGRSSSASSRSAVALPVRAGQRLGEVRSTRRQARRRSPLVAAASVAEPGRPGKVAWYARRTVHHLADRLENDSGGSSRDRHGDGQRRARPHADGARVPDRLPPPLERGAHPRRRQGDQRRPRAEAPRRTGRRDRARRRPDGDADHRGADLGGDPQRLRPHRGRVAARRRQSSIRPRAPTPRSTSGAPR